MAMEVSCGQCSGRLLVDTPGVVVACPHCGVHLSIPMPTAEALPAHNSILIDADATQATSSVADSSCTNVPPGPLPPESSRAETIVLTGSQKSVLSRVQDADPPSSIFHNSDDDRTGTSTSADVGWPSSPNLFLNNAPQPKDPAGVDLHQSEPAKSDSGTHGTTSNVQDFSWMNAGNVNTNNESPAKFAFGEPIAGNALSDLTIEKKGLFANEESSLTSSADTSPAELPVPVDTPANEISQVDESVREADTPNPNLNPMKGFDVVDASANPDMSPVTPIDSATTPSDFAPNFAVQEQQAPSFEFAGVNSIGTMNSSPVGLLGLSEPVGQPIAAMSVSTSKDGGNSRTQFLMMCLLIVGSYASLVTIYLVYLLLFGRAHQLESLPDLKTVQEQRGRAAVPRPDNDLPPGHELKLGQTQRFGIIRVTPLRVTQGPITFAHQSGDIPNERSPSAPVLKLWLKLENVSTTQSITPIDTTLMFFRRVLDNRVASYNAIFRVADRKQKNLKACYPFDRMAADSEWSMVGQHTNQPLEPLETYETFVPSEENFDDLTGDLVWRVHFRKGYGPKSGNGVTTLIDVRFKSSDIKPDAA